MTPASHPTNLRDLVSAFEAKEIAIVHLRWAHDFAGIKQPVWIERVLDRLEGSGDPRPEHDFMELGADQTVTVFTLLANESYSSTVVATRGIAAGSVTFARRVLLLFARTSSFEGAAQFNRGAFSSLASQKPM